MKNGEPPQLRGGKNWFLYSADISINFQSWRDSQSCQATQWQKAENVGLLGTLSLRKCEIAEFVKWIFPKRLLKTPNLEPSTTRFDGYIITFKLLTLFMWLRWNMLRSMSPHFKHTILSIAGVKYMLSLPSMCNVTLLLSILHIKSSL